MSAPDDGERNLGCGALIFLFVFALLIATSIDNLTKQVKRIADHTETVR